MAHVKKAEVEAGPPLQVAVASDEELERRLAEAGLKIVELYSWAGPCRSVVSTFKQLREDWEAKCDELQFLKVEADKCQLLEEAKAHGMRSAPRFLVYQNGILKQEINMADVPAIKKAVKEYFEPLVAPLVIPGVPPPVNPFALAIAARAPPPAPEPQPEQPAVPEGTYGQLLPVEG